MSSVVLRCVLTPSCPSRLAQSRPPSPPNSVAEVALYDSMLTRCSGSNLTSVVTTKLQANWALRLHSPPAAAVFSFFLSFNPSSTHCVCLSQRHGRPLAPVAQPRASLVMVGRTVLTSRSLCNSIKLLGMEEGRGGLFIACTQRRRVILKPAHLAPWGSAWVGACVRVLQWSALTFCWAPLHVYAWHNRPRWKNLT